MVRVIQFLLAFALGAASLLYLQSQGWQTLRYRFSPVTEFADGASYQGQHNEQGQLDGWGRMTWRNGDSYEGEFRQGLFHGQGTLISAQIAIYQGQFVDGYEEGRGRLDYSDGSHYEGEFKAGLFDGQGRFTLVDGGVYDGTFVAGKMQGQGRWRYSDQSMYTGEVKDGIRHGQGELLQPDGAKYTGEFSDGRMQGNGIFIDAKGASYSGEFQQDMFTGKGIYTDPDGYTYIGEFENWQLHGAGMQTDKEGNQWQGQFKRGLLDGKGSFIAKNGEEYNGDFKLGHYHGKGKLVQPDGDIYEGTFEYGRKHGAGELTYKQPLDGLTRIKGRWHYNKLVNGGKSVKIYSGEEITHFAMEQQSTVLKQALESIRVSDPHKIEFYSLVIAGDGTEEVFRRETRFIENLFTRQYGVADTGIYLVNSQRSLDKPLASLSSISAAIQRIAERMDKGKDIFFLYITSHGSKKRTISLKHNGITLADIPAAWLGKQLKNSGIQHRVVLLSACYSGGFIDDLRDEYTLVMTAASAEKTSFGCSDDSQFTYFGRAYFQDALQPGVDFEAAFERAKALVSEWESEQKLTPSEPQIHRSEAVLKQLRRWQDERSANDLNP